MKALVTGGTGFLGSHIVERLLEQGHEVVALARESSNTGHLKTTDAKIILGALEDYESLGAAVNGVDMVFHAAARVMPGWGSWKDFEDTAVKGTDNLLRASVEAGVKRFIYVSSGTVLGKNSLGETPADETADYDLGPLCYHTFYDWSKLMGEQLALEYHGKGLIEVAVVRPCMIYGPRCRLLTDRVFRYVKMLPIVIWPGKANARTALVYVTDVVDCILLAAMDPKAAGQIYNIAPPEEIRFRDFIGAMARAYGRPELRMTVPLLVVYLYGALTELWAKLVRAKAPPFLTRADVRFLEEGMNIDCSKAMKELGWKPQVSIEEGTRLYIEWRRSQGSRNGGNGERRQTVADERS